MLYPFLWLFPKGLVLLCQALCIQPLFKFAAQRRHDYHPPFRILVGGSFGVDKVALKFAQLAQMGQGRIRTHGSFLFLETLVLPGFRRNKHQVFP